MLQIIMKNVSRNKCLLCFRPVVDMESVLESKGVVDRSACQGLPFVNVENKEVTKVSMTPKRNFSRVVKAVMFGTILTKRVRERKSYRQDSCQSKRSLSMNKSKNRASMVDNTNIHQEIKTISGLSHSSSYSSSASSSSSSGSASSSDIAKESCSNHQGLEEKPKKVDMGCSSFNSGIYLLVISLIITILWGRLCAIVFTSIWLYFVPRRRHVGYGQQEYVMKLAKPESPETTRRRVILEGLLERNHHRGH